MKNLNLKHSRRIYREALKIIPGGSQTISKKPEQFAFGTFPIYIQKGKGCRVRDVDGNEYIDYISALGPITLGYAYPATDRAVKRQLTDGVIFSVMHPLEVEAAKAIIEVVPCAEMVRFFKTGAEATSAAIRIARAYTGREKIANFGYHGWHDTWTARNAYPQDRGVPAILKEYIIDFQYGDYDSEKSLEAVLTKCRGEIAGIIMEPVVYSDTNCKEYLDYVRKLADKHKAVLIFDEIVTGFRLSLGGAQEYFGVTPDISCFAKGMANGLPIAATVGKKKMMEIAKELIISSTYGGETLSLAAVVASLAEYKKKNVIKHLWTQGNRLVNGLNRLAQETGLKVEFKGFVPMSKFDFTYADENLNGNLHTLFLQEMAKRKILFRRGGLNFITYSHKKDDIDETIKTASEVFKFLTCTITSGTVKEKLLVTEITESIRKFR